MATPPTSNGSKRPRRAVSRVFFESNDDHIAEPLEKKPRLHDNDVDDDDLPIQRGGGQISIGSGRDGPGKKHTTRSVGSSTTAMLKEPPVTTATTTTTFRQLRIPHGITPSSSMIMVDTLDRQRRQAPSLSSDDGTITLDIAAPKDEFGLCIPSSREVPVHIDTDIDIAASTSTPIKPKPPNKRRVCSLFFQMITVLCACSMISFGLVGRDDASSSRGVIQQLHNPKSCIHVPGAGFSGFWFTLGRLQSLPDPFAQTLYCYSAGCLAAVSILNGWTMEQVSTFARGAQHEWLSGQTSRYHVVPQFVDQLLALEISNATTTGTTMAREDEHRPTWLSQLNVITTEPNHNNGWGVQTTIRTPTSIPELRELLVQTAWIPMVTGGDLLYQGHMDGAFSTAQHPKCDKTLSLPLEWDLMSNVLNVNLDKISLERHWQKGMEYGV